REDEEPQAHAGRFEVSLESPLSVRVIGPEHEQHRDEEEERGNEEVERGGGERERDRPRTRRREHSASPYRPVNVARAGPPSPSLSRRGRHSRMYSPAGASPRSSPSRISTPWPRSSWWTGNVPLGSDSTDSASMPTNRAPPWRSAAAPWEVRATKSSKYSSRRLHRSEFDVRKRTRSVPRGTARSSSGPISFRSSGIRTTRHGPLRRPRS